MDFRKDLLVKPGNKFRLSDFDPGHHGKHESEKHAEKDLAHYRAKISNLQRTLYGDGSKSLLVVLQGIDGAGKDGTCWHVISAMDPQGVHVAGFKQPTPAELGHDFLWRVHAHAPQNGEIAIFNITDPHQAALVDVVPLDPPGPVRNIAPEGLAFIPAGDSPLGQPLLAVACEVSGTTVLFRVRAGR